MIEQRRCLGTIAYMGGIMSIPEPFAWAWSEMREFSSQALCGENDWIYFTRTKYSLHDAARNDLVKRMKGDWLLMLDTDLDFDPDLAARMVKCMQTYNLQVLTGIYPYKKQPELPILYMWNEKDQKHEIVGDWDRSVTIFDVDSAGAGCMLIHRSVIEKLQLAYPVAPFTRDGEMGEDQTFCKRLREQGINLCCNWKIECQHLDYNAVRLQNKPGLKAVNTYKVNGFGNPGEVRAGS